MGTIRRRTAMFAVAAVLAASGAAAQAPMPVIPVIVKDTTSFYWQTVLAGARHAGRDLHVRVPELGAQAESDISGQISILENAVAENPAAIVIAPTQFAALGPPITQAAKRVKIIGIDSAADSHAFTAFLTTNNVTGGERAADALASAIAARYGKAEGEVAIITSLPGVGSLDQRRQGFKQELSAKYPGLKVIADRIADGQATTALNIMTDLLTAHPHLHGVFASNLIMAQGAGQAVAENRAANDVKLVAFDSDSKLVQLLGNGTIAALIVQDPYRMGYDGVKLALEASKGQPIPALTDTGVTIITKATMNGARAQQLLNPDVKS